MSKYRAESNFLEDGYHPYVQDRAKVLAKNSICMYAVPSLVDNKQPKRSL